MTDFTKIKKLFNINSSDGFSESEISNILNLVNKLPDPLIDYYKELGNYSFNNWQDNLIRSNGGKFYQYERFLDDEYVIICCENQGVCVAGIKKTKKKKNNPPVYFSLDYFHSDMKNWEVGCENLINYIHGFTYIHAALGLDHNGYLDLNENGVKFVRDNFKNKNIMFKNWMGCGDWEFYSDHDDTIIMLAGEPSLWYASNNENHYLEMENKLKGIK
jgi:hypothetical protein